MKTLFSVLVVVILIACKPSDEKTALKMFEQIHYPEPSLQKLVVDINALNSTRGMMRVYERTDTGRSWGNPVMSFEVVIGKNGLAFDSTQFKKLEYGHYKHEGDGCSPAAGKDHLGNDRYQVDTGKCFPYFAKHKYCSACLPVCVYNHKEWAKDFEGFQTKLFPEVVMEIPPTPVDQITGIAHSYNLIKRGI